SFVDESDSHAVRERGPALRAFAYHSRAVAGAGARDLRALPAVARAGNAGTGSTACALHRLLLRHRKRRDANDSLLRTGRAARAGGRGGWPDRTPRTTL